MTRRQFAKAVALPLLGGPTLLKGTARPNVIIVMADDQGFGDFSSHGHPEIRTPHLDKLRSESVRFTDFHSSPMCTPTRAQLLTGRDALVTRAMNVSSGRTLMRTDLPTLADAFQGSGYRTGLFGKWHLGDTYPYRPQDRGFDECVWYPSSHVGSVPDAWNNDYFNDSYRHNGHLQQFAGYSGDVFFNEAMRWMEAAARGGGRFFCYIPLNVAHTPLLAPPQFIEPYRKLPPAAARYAAMVSNIDFNIGRLETWLGQTRLRENTIVIYLSDNGAGRGTLRFNAGMKGSKTELYEGGHRVPCFVRWPAGGVSGGRDIAVLAQMQDWFPTLVDLCGLKRLPGFAPNGVNLSPVLRGSAGTLPDRVAVVQFSRMPRGDQQARPTRNDAAVMWRKWRLIGGTELYDVAADPGQERNLISVNGDIAANLQSHYDRWWRDVEPLLDSFVPVVVGSDRENPVLVSACEWADVFVDQSAQVRRGERKNGVWHLHVEQAGDYLFSLRRWPRDCDAAIPAAAPPHRGEDGEFPAGEALPIRRARLRIGDFDRTVEVAAEDREASFRMRLAAGPARMQSWFLDAEGREIAGAYYVYAERTSPGSKRDPVRVVFDTDIMGDVDDVGAVAALHALAGRGETQILAMGVSSKHASSPLCLDALNTYFGRPDIPIGVNKGEGFLRDSKYADAIAQGWPRKLSSAAAAPDAVELYKRTLRAQPDGSVVLITVGQLTNVSNLLKSPGGADLARRKVRLWVCMGAHFPAGREANIWHDAAPARHAVENWPGRIVFSGWEVGQAVLTGGGASRLPASNPVRRAYELYNGAQPHKSWDQTAVLYGVRCVDQDRGLWTLSGPGACVIDERGANAWRSDPLGKHQYLIPRMAPAQVSAIIEELMLTLPDSA